MCSAALQTAKHRILAEKNVYPFATATRPVFSAKDQAQYTHNKADRPWQAMPGLFAFVQLRQSLYE